MSSWRRPEPDPWGGPEMDRKGALWYHVYPFILLVIDPCSNPLRPGLLLHPYGWLTRQLQLAAQVPYASFRNRGALPDPAEQDPPDREAKASESDEPEHVAGC